MPNKEYTLINYGKRFKEDVIGLATNTATKFIVPDEIDGTTLKLRANLFKNNSKLTEIDFNHCVTAPDYCCYSCSNLTKVTFAEGMSSVGNYAFYSDQKLIIPPHALDSLTSIPDYAFYYTSRSANEGFQYKPQSEATIGSYAFYGSQLTELTGTIKQISSYGCSTSLLQTLHVTLSGTVNSYAFDGATAISQFDLSPTSHITALGSYAFRNCGYNRSDASNNKFIWNLLDSTFTAIPNSCWQYNKESIFYFNHKLTTINDYAFANGTNNIIYLNSLPDLQSTNVFNTASSTTVILDYTLDLATLQQKTYWKDLNINIQSGIMNYAGTLPPYNKTTGTALTWYTDMEHTVSTTVATDSNTPYYVDQGQEREMWYVKQGLLNAQLHISDGTNVYNDFVPINSTVTITPQPTDSTKTQLYILRVNGVDYTAEGSATITVNSDLDVIAMFWDGEEYPFYPTLGDNSWEQIKLASDLHIVPSTWHVGDEIDINYDGQLCPFRLVDTTGKYLHASDDSPAQFTFESVHVIPNKYAVATANYSSSFNHGPLDLALNGGAIYTAIDPAVRAVVTPVKVLYCSYGNSWGGPFITTEDLMFFIPRVHDIGSAQARSVSAEYDTITPDEYYQLHDTDEARRKSYIDTPLKYQTYCTMSGASYNATESRSYICQVGDNGNVTVNGAYYALPACIRFAV